MTKIPFRATKNWENVNLARYPGNGSYEIPRMAPCKCVDVDRWVPFNAAMSVPKEERSRTGVHFWVDDYQFLRTWTHPDRYMRMLREFGAVCSPDFSVYTDFPVAMKIWNVYRNAWLGCYWQEMGVNVVPTAMWTSPDQPYVWDGYPMYSIMAVSSVGSLKKAQDRENFVQGYQCMLDQLHPKEILFYGTVPEECGGRITRIESFQSRFDRLREQKRKGQDLS